MKTQGNTILITGGSSGIGLSLARVLTEAGNRVLICGRSETRLAWAKEQVPGLETFSCDVSSPRDREALVAWALREHPDLNVLINNAGIQKAISFTEGAPELEDDESEIDTNLTAAIRLCAAFLPHLLEAGREGAIVNVTSGLAFVPLAGTPVYSATKAALHAFTMSLRTQLRGTSVKVFEVIPPIVDTNLHREPGARQQARSMGIEPERVARATLKALRRDRYQVSVGRATDLVVASRLAPGFFHWLLNRFVSA